MSEDFRDRFKEASWVRVYAAAISASYITSAGKIADNCLKEFKERFEKEETE